MDFSICLLWALVFQVGTERCVLAQPSSHPAPSSSACPPPRPPLQEWQGRAMPSATPRLGNVAGRPTRLPQGPVQPPDPRGVPWVALRENAMEEGGGGLCQPGVPGGRRRPGPESPAVLPASEQPHLMLRCIRAGTLGSRTSTQSPGGLQARGWAQAEHVKLEEGITGRWSSLSEGRDERRERLSGTASPLVCVARARRAPQLEETPETHPSSRAEGLLFLHGLESNPGSSLQTEEEARHP